VEPLVITCAGVFPSVVVVAMMNAMDEPRVRPGGPRDLDGETWSALRSHLDEPEAIELCQLVGHYEMLATTLRVLRVAPDAHR
jgi:hypothetical protein